MYSFSKTEKKWNNVWREKKIYEPSFNPPASPALAGTGGKKKPFYNLMMFPYPSAEGLHIGNMYAFTGSDIYGRFKRMQGCDVFEPIGLDGFGIHSENYALKIGEHPKEAAKRTQKNFYRQLTGIGNSFAWEEKLETYDPSYYQWTQWIFLQLFKNGLAYRAKAPVNWCPSCKTVLADEQVINGKCERCDTEAIKKNLEQWFFRITKYAEKLLRNLEKIDWSEKVKIAQRNWIGKSEGTSIEFRIKNSELRIEVFTTRPDTILGATYLVLAPEHPLVASLLAIKNAELRIQNAKEVKNYIGKTSLKSEQERIAEGREKTGIELKGIKAINPATKQEIPIWVSDYVIASYGTGAIMAVPAYDERDAEFAKKFNLPVIKNPLLPMKEALEKSEGKKDTRYRLRDWLISRQRYWGPPIPLIFCNSCKKQAEKFKIEEKFDKGERENPGWIAVPEKDLPVELPYIKDFRPTGTDKSPLASHKEFYQTKCPRCGNPAVRETDVSDNFLDSAWYYLGYLILGNPKSQFQNPKQTQNTKYKIRNTLIRKWLPVDMYIGGAEHSVLHLLYSRFLAMALKDFGCVHFDEPFAKFRAHGLIVREGKKMSKSKGNVVNPDEYIKKFGADALRMALMFLGPFEEGGDFRDSAVVGIVRFLEKIYRLKSKIPAFAKAAPFAEVATEAKSAGKQNSNQKLKILLHQTIKKVSEDIENLHYNTAISALMILVNEMEKQPVLNPAPYTLLLKLLAPFAPYLTEELNYQLNPKPYTLNPSYSIHLEKWPTYNPRFVQKEDFELIIQINGKMRGRANAELNISEEQAKKLALSQPKIKNLLGGKHIRKSVFVQNKLINFVMQP